MRTFAIERLSSLGRTIQPHFTSAICQLGYSGCCFVAECTISCTVVPTIASLTNAGYLPMKSNKSNLLSTVAAVAVMLAGACVHAVGFQQGFAADQGGKPLVIGIWYPHFKAFVLGDDLRAEQQQHR
jgi:hypothetical protein